jgi:uncharacterized protein YbcC (UPF0753/DUF2309 family)
MTIHAIDGSKPTEDNPLASIVDRASRRVAPLWPLKHFVAVNPYLGLTDQSFEGAARTMARVAGARSTLSRSFYAAALDEKRMTPGDLEAALAEAPAHPGLPETAAELEALARAGGNAELTPIATMADVAQAVTGEDWPRFVTERISAWASAFWDQGQAPWRCPFRGLSPYAAWRAEAEVDRAPEIMGLDGFRSHVRALPEDAEAAIAACLDRLGVPVEAAEIYLHRLLMTVSGWASYARYQMWEAELHGGADAAVAELLAVRLAWEVAIFESLGRERLGARWTEAKAGFTAELDPEVDARIAVDLVLQAAFEKAVEREMTSKVGVPRAKAKRDERPAAQAAFCIDVRSEVFRRALEAADPEVETIGFAGFFGFPVEYVRLGHERGGKACPVLLTPGFTIEEKVVGAPDAASEKASETRTLKRRAEAAWRSFKFAAVSCFGFVGPVGLAYAKKLVTDSIGKSRPVGHPDAFGLEDAPERGPSLTPREVGGRTFGMTREQRIETAAGVLGAMSLTKAFARVVLLAGHGSTTVNNPHATGLDCGACGGHTGEANARIAAAVLNDRDVRLGLRDKGIDIPEDTYFVAGLHDTATDEVVIYDRPAVPASHAEDLARLEQSLDVAGQVTRAERSRKLVLEPGKSVDDAVIHRSRDWSQVRPEWGLAGCSAFVAAPRSRTAGSSLEGRSFLHDYAWRDDQGFGVLELIMTAPMVVASWISLQYYGSTVDNAKLGSGNKVLHNVVGTVGVLEGNGGDLRVGLPWQSVHDGERYVHEPARLKVMIEAPVEAMNAIIEKHAMVRDLLDHRWLELYHIDDSGQVAKKYMGHLEWRALGAEPEATRMVG